MNMVFRNISVVDILTNREMDKKLSVCTFELVYVMMVVLNV